MPRSIQALLGLTVLAGCGTPSKQPKRDKAVAPPPKITQFYVTPNVVRDGQPSKLCYSVEGAATVTLDPPVERVWPAYSRCFEVNPTKNTTYTLTAENAGGVKVTATTKATVGPPSVRILEVSVNALEVHAGEAFPFCVTARHAVSWQLSGGHWRTPPGPAGGCAVDHPTKTTTYVITAVGALGETDTERVTATVK